MLKIFYKSFLWILLSSYTALACPRPIDLDEVYTDSLDRKKFIESTLYADSELQTALYSLLRDTKTLLEEKNVTYGIHFGTLLGAVRHQAIIPWDDDLDLWVIQEDEEKLKSLVGHFEAKGYDLFSDAEANVNGKGEDIVGYKVYSRAPVSLKTGQVVYPFIDLFLYQQEGNKYVLSRPAAQKIWPKAWYEKTQLEQRQTYHLNDIEIWGPSEAETWLSRNYPKWNKKVVHYKKHFESEPRHYVWTLGDLSLYSGPQVTSAKDNKIYWNHFYKKDLIERKPSTFWEFIIQNEYVKPNQTLLDMGCGNGRDTFYFWEWGLSPVGIDSSSSAIAANKAFAKNLRSGAKFKHLSVTEEDLEKLRYYRVYDAIYARFFLHSITEKDQMIFFRFLKDLRKGSRLFLEFRTDKDPMFQLSKTKVSPNEAISDHYRRYIHFEHFCQTLKELDFSLIFAEERDGLSIRGEDNPFLGRIVAQKGILSPLPSETGTSYENRKSTKQVSPYENAYAPHSYPGKGLPISYGQSETKEERHTPVITQGRVLAPLPQPGETYALTRKKPSSFHPQFFSPKNLPLLQSFNPRPEERISSYFSKFPKFASEFDGNLNFFVKTLCSGEGMNPVDVFNQRENLYKQRRPKDIFTQDLSSLPYQIPQIFHTVWITNPLKPRTIPPQYIEIAEKAADQNPVSQGWKHYVWVNDRNLFTDTIKSLENKGSPLQVRDYHDLSFPTELSTILEDEIQKNKFGKASDLLRYLLLRELGGIYKDTDYLINQDCTPYNKAYTFYAGIESMSTFIGNALIASTPQHPVMEEIVTLILRNYSPYVPPYIQYAKNRDTAFATVLLTGPSILSTAFYKKAGLDGRPDIIFPPMIVYPTSNPVYPQKKSLFEGDPIPEKSIGIHFWHTTWSNPKRYGSNG